MEHTKEVNNSIFFAIREYSDHDVQYCVIEYNILTGKKYIHCYLDGLLDFYIVGQSKVIINYEKIYWNGKTIKILEEWYNLPKFAFIEVNGNLIVLLDYGEYCKIFFNDMTSISATCKHISSSQNGHNIVFKFGFNIYYKNVHKSEHNNLFSDAMYLSYGWKFAKWVVNSNRLLLFRNDIHCIVYNIEINMHSDFKIICNTNSEYRCYDTNGIIFYIDHQKLYFNEDEYNNEPKNNLYTTQSHLNY